MLFPDDFDITHIEANDFEFKKSETVHVTGRSYHGLTFRLSGKISLTPDGSDKKLYSDKSCITFVPKGCSYSTDIIEDGRMLIIHFAVRNEHEGLVPFVLKPSCPIAFENMYRSLIERYRSVGGRHDYVCLSMVYEILANLIHELSEGGAHPIPKRMRKVKSFIDENYGSRDITVTSLSDSCGVSEVYFRREFRNCFGCSPIEYIKKVRIENAKALLSTGMYPVSEVATRCGFDSISYFSYEFKRKCGESPLEFAKRYEYGTVK